MSVSHGARTQFERFLNQPHLIAKMIQASDRGEPAAWVVAAELHQAFRRVEWADKVKQEIGELIREIMELQGYRKRQEGVACPQNPIFTVASVYERDDSFIEISE